MTAACLVTSACSSTSSDEGAGRKLINLIYYGGTTVPPSGPGLVSEVPCPQVTVMAGGAAINSYSGGGAAPETLRSQLSITNLARECVARADGATIVKVGVEGRALVGPAGAAGRFDTPVRFVIKRGEQVLASATRRATVALSPGEMQGTFLVVEEGLVVPPNTGDFDIEVGLGGSGAAERPTRRARR